MPKQQWLFREQLAHHRLIDKLFQRFDEQLWQSELIPERGQLIDANPASMPKSRNTRYDNKQIKEGKTPDGWGEQLKKRRTI